MASRLRYGDGASSHERAPSYRQQRQPQRQPYTPEDRPYTSDFEEEEWLEREQTRSQAGRRGAALDDTFGAEDAGASLGEQLRGRQRPTGAFGQQGGYSTHRRDMGYADPMEGSRQEQPSDLDFAPRTESYRGRGPKSYRRSDERILEEINQCLTDDDWIDATEIEVQVEQGEVTLSGSVTNRSAKRRAEDLAERISGVSDVQNNIRVRREGSQLGSDGGNSDRSATAQEGARRAKAASEPSEGRREGTNPK